SRRTLRRPEPGRQPTAAFLSGAARAVLPGNTPRRGGGWSLARRPLAARRGGGPRGAPRFPIDPTPPPSPPPPTLPRPPPCPPPAAPTAVHVGLAPPRRTRRGGAAAPPLPRRPPEGAGG